MDLSKARLERVVKSGTQGAAEKTQELYTCELDEIGVVTNLCFQNQDAANNINLKIGVKSGGLMHAYQAIAVLAAGLYQEIDNPIYLREGDTLQVVFTPDGANTEWQVWAEVHVLFSDHSKT